jgi:hypothetical protein
MPSVHPEQQQGDVRRSDRQRMGVRIKYRRKVLRLVAETIDVSCHGIKLAGMERLSIGDVLWVGLPGLEPRKATVVWTDRLIAGCCFAEPLHPAVLEAVIHGRLG